MGELGVSIVQAIFEYNLFKVKKEYKK